MKTKLLISILLGLLIYSCSKDSKSDNNTFDKKSLTTQIANGIIEPSLNKLIVEAQNFIVCSDVFEQGKTQANLDNLQGCWKNMATQWQSTQFFMVKDLKYSSQEYEMAFWPIDPIKVDANLGSTQAIDAAKIKQVGADQKGIFALEYLLFNLDYSSLSTNPRAIEYITEIAKNNLIAANQLKTVWETTYKPKFIESTDNFVTSSIPTITNRLIEFTELVKNQKLGYALGLSKYSDVKAERLESIYAKYSLDLIQENTSILKTVYLGGYNNTDIGYDNYLISFGQKGIDLDLKIKAKFEDIKNFQSTIPKPIFDKITLSKTEYDSLYIKWKELIILLKTEFIMMLEITPTFSDADGD